MVLACVDTLTSKKFEGLMGVSWKRRLAEPAGQGAALTCLT